ncbi:hypothetical protein K438DRAFT_1871693 [Mycena galopus ATCC 62051]|nr:hypothetical protein K438DRAFT_1882017 [Mycena galopus ATCC 62051]KAF8145578.1 hypothetical protein K438DRAFT_1871693 [Mycena galopus ATCC 62051]
MKSSTTKQTPLLFSPYRCLSRTPPRLPRDALVNAKKTNTKLFASQPIDGQGALSENVSDTQYFDQYGVNVAAKENEESAPIFVPESLSSPSSSSEAFTHFDDGSQPDEWLVAYNEENSWDDAAMRRAVLAGTKALSRDPSPVPSEEPVLEIKFELEDEVKFEASNHSAETFHSVAESSETTFTNLSVFENWVIGRIRDSHSNGISFADNLRRLQKRCEFAEGRDHHRRRILAEINMLSRNLD